MKVNKTLTTAGAVLLSITLMTSPMAGVVSAEGSNPTSNMVTATAFANVSFRDLKSSHWAYNAIQNAVSKGYFKGYSDGTFRPNNEVTREELATLLARVSTNEEKSGGSVPSDVRGRWSESAIQEAIAKGFINPSQYSAGLKPQQAASRVEMARWMIAGLGQKNPDFKQAVLDTKDTIVPVAEFHKGGLAKSDYGVVSVALGTGLINGFQDGSFGGNKTTTRAEVAALLLRYESVQEKDPASFNQLEQLREVGLTGSNVESMGAVYAENGYGKVITFDQIRGNEFPLKYNRGKAKLYNLIIVDQLNKDALYTKMFLGKGNTMEKSYGRDEFVVMLYKGLTPNIEMEMSDYINSWNQFFLGSPGYETGNEKSWGIPSLPLRQSWIQTKFFTVGKEKKYWALQRMTRVYDPDLRKSPIELRNIPIGDLRVRIKEGK